jgi:hypothetical protein
MNIILIISLVLLISLVSVRYIELRDNKQTIISRTIRKADNHVSNFYIYSRKQMRSFLGFLSYIKHTFIEKGWNSITHSVHFTKKKVDTLHDKLNGKGEIKKSDHVSFYLQSVSDHKKSIHDQKK